VPVPSGTSTCPTTLDHTPPPSPEVTAKIGDLAADAGIQRVHVLAWRDLADVEAGGSEVFVDEVARHWAAAGLDVTVRTSFAAGQAPIGTRNGYVVVRRAGRYLVFPRAVANELTGRHGRRDALVEVWNGVPFLSPVWARGPRLVVLHHPHTEMWSTVLPPSLARLGDLLERRIAPPLYRRTTITTLSQSSRRQLVEDLGLNPDRVVVVPPGLHHRFSPGPPGSRSATPLVAAVGRMVPAKRFDLLIEQAARAREQVPDLRLVIAGDGYDRPRLEATIARLGADAWVDLPGRVRDHEVVDLYRSAWVVASASQSEGWGLSLTEGAACGTPAVATRIAGHVDSVDDGVTGLLADGDDLGDALARVLVDHDLRARPGAAALVRAAEHDWSRTATELMRLLAAEAARRPGRSGR
jgi:glycosyltransferase involved in cell wall biosynthesis